MRPANKTTTGRRVGYYGPNPMIQNRAVNIDLNPSYYGPRKKPTLSRVQKVKEWLIGSKGILRKDLLAGVKRKLGK